MLSVTPTARPTLAIGPLALGGGDTDIDGAGHARWGTTHFAGCPTLTKSATDTGSDAWKWTVPYFAVSRGAVRELLKQPYYCRRCKTDGVDR
jgi:hypothetical protein